MQRGNVNGAMKLLTNNMGGLNDDTLRLLQLKHPTGKAADENTILQGPEKKINPIVYETIDESSVLRAAQITKGGSGPSGLDADG